MRLHGPFDGIMGFSQVLVARAGRGLQKSAPLIGSCTHTVPAAVHMRHLVPARAGRGHGFAGRGHAASGVCAPGSAAAAILYLLCGHQVRPHGSGGTDSACEGMGHSLEDSLNQRCRVRDPALESMYEAMRSVPSLHIIGDRDPVKPLTNRLIEAFERPVVITHARCVQRWWGSQGEERR